MNPLRAGNAPLSVKISFGPAIAIIALIICALLVDSLLSDFMDKTRQIGEERFRVSSELLRASSDLNGTVMDLYYVLAASSSGQDAKDSGALLSNVGQRLVKIKDTVSSVQNGLQDKEAADALATVSSDLAKFEQPISFLKDMIDIDPKSAVSFLDPLRKNLTGVQDKLARVADGQRSQALSMVNQLDHQGTQARNGFKIAIGAIIFVLAALTVGLLRNLLRSIMLITTTTSALAKGNLEVDIAGLARKDELGTIVEALAVFRDSLKASAQHQKERQESDARAALEKREAALSVANELESSLQNLLEDLDGAVKDMELNATNLDTQSDRGRDEAGKAVSAMDTAKENVQAVAGAAEELSTSFVEISRRVQEASSITRDSMRSVQESTTKMDQLSQQADQIGNIIMLIRDIASQTNLLALNATIEAARAGDAGKGFAVVANEVKTLANQTAKATEEISNQIIMIQSAAKDATTAIDGVRTTVDQNVQVATAIAAAVEQQEAATREIARNIQLASSGTIAVSASIESLRGIVDYTRKSSASLLSSSEELGKETTNIKRSMASVILKLRS